MKIIKFGRAVAITMITTSCSTGPQIVSQPVNVLNEPIVTASGGLKDLPFCYNRDSKYRMDADAKYAEAQKIMSQRPPKGSSNEELMKFLPKIQEFSDIMYGIALIGHPDAVKYQCNFSSSRMAPVDARLKSLYLCAAMLDLSGSEQNFVDKRQEKAIRQNFSNMLFYSKVDEVKNTVCTM